MSAFMDALRSCTGLSGPYSCSNGPLRSSSLRAEKAGRPSGRPVVEGERALSWTRRAFIHMTRAIKEHRSRCFSLSVSSAFLSCVPPHPLTHFLPTSNREKGANCLLWEPKIIEPPIFFPPLPFSPLFQAPYSFSKECDSVRETREEKYCNFPEECWCKRALTLTLAVRGCAFGSKSKADFSSFIRLVVEFEVLNNYFLYWKVL